jgi:polysaccharide biosynthesis/export protein
MLLSVRCLRNIIVLVGLLSFTSSCLSNKKITYFQSPFKGGRVDQETWINFANEIETYVLKNGDVLAIDFLSTNRELVGLIDVQNQRNPKITTSGNHGIGDPIFFSGYPINSRGEIELPMIGNIKVAGRTVEEAKVFLESQLSYYFKDKIIVQLKLGGTKVILLGEFKDPGIKYVFNNKVTIFEAIALGGDTNLFANKSKLLLIRQYTNGTKIHHLNLNDQSIFSSPYYFLHSNDLLYLEPLKRRQFIKSDNMLSTMNSIVSILSSIVLLTILISRNQS